jgi:hypothetical protein
MQIERSADVQRAPVIWRFWVRYVAPGRSSRSDLQMRGTSYGRLASCQRDPVNAAAPDSDKLATVDTAFLEPNVEVRVWVVHPLACGTSRSRARCWSVSIGNAVSLIAGPG